MLGVLGGMGPLATVDFMAKLVACTPVVDDADHIPVLLKSIPQSPDRTAAIFGQGPSPLGELCAQAEGLHSEGATLGVMPCNTAHHWFEDLSAHVGLEAEGCKGHQIGLLATPSTLQSGFYQRRLEVAGYPYLVPDDALLDR